MENENYGAEQELEVTACPEEVTEELAEIVEEMPAEEVSEETAEEIVEKVTEEETEEATEEETEEATEEETEEETVEELPKKKTVKLWQVILAGIGAGLLLVALALLLLHGLGFEIVPKQNNDDETGEPAFVAVNDYSGDEKAVEKAADTVVATLGGKELTNKKLQVFYNIVVNDFVMNYYSYLSQIGLDYSKPLNEQKCYFEQDKSWEEYFVNAALETWINYQSVVLLADENGYQLDAESKEMLDKLPAEMDEQAKSSGYESAEQMLKEEMNCTVTEYVDYWTMYQIGYGFTGQTPADEVVEKYFNEHKAEYEEEGITKESGPIVDVRHILIQPEGGTTSEDGYTTTYSDAEWAAAKKEAEAILKQWKSGEATEDSFAALANEKSADGGSNTTGGLYEGITADASYVEPFLNWCMDKKNKKGATGIVKTEYGYHIMFMSKTEEYWFYAATYDYLSEQTTSLIEQAKEKWPAESDLSKVCIAEIKLY